MLQSGRPSLQSGSKFHLQTCGLRLACQAKGINALSTIAITTCTWCRTGNSIQESKHALSSFKAYSAGLKASKLKLLNSTCQLLRI